LDFWPDGGFAGVGPEINGHARTGFSFGGDLMLGVDLNDYFSAGLKTAFFDNFDTLSAFETLLFFRFYLPWLRLPKKTDGPFAQLEAGSVVFFERGYHENLEAFPAFSAGLSVGWRFNLGEHWYVEPATRAGYPHIWGFGVTVGIRFKTQRTVISEQKKEEEIEKQDEEFYSEIEPEQTNEIIEEIIEEEIEEPIIVEETEEETIEEIVEEKKEETDEGIKIIQDDDGNLRLQVFSIIFRADHADFTGLSDETVENNYATIRRVAELLDRYKDYRIIIEGHANPTTPEGPARERERYSLTRLSEQRALKVLEELGNMGISYARMNVLGAGFSKTIAPYNDYENVWKNRRVEFILIME
jgi:outer membrane protein OmpA-like peptidoglycan-associated protein